MTLLDASLTATSASSTTTLPITLANAQSVGSFIILSVGANGAAVTCTAADNSTQGGTANTYTQRSTSTYTSNTITSYVLACKVTRAMLAGDVITVTFSSARTNSAVRGGVFDDGVSTTLDGAAATALGATAAPSAGPTGDPATTRALVILAGASRGAALSFAGASGLTTGGYSSSGTSTTNRAAYFGYAYVTTPGTQTPAGTLGVSDNWTVSAVCFDAASTTVTGTGALTAAPSTLAGAGTATATGTGALTSPVGALAGAATLTTTGTGALTAPTRTLAGAGNLGWPGTIRINYIRDPDTQDPTNTFLWEPINGDLLPVADLLEFTAIAGDPSWLVPVLTPDPLVALLPVELGDELSTQVQVQNTHASDDFEFQLVFDLFDVDMIMLDDSAGPVVTLAGQAADVLTHSHVITNPDVTQIRVRVVVNRVSAISLDPGDTFLLGLWLLGVNDPQPTRFFSGASPDAPPGYYGGGESYVGYAYDWLGLPNQSISRETELLAPVLGSGALTSRATLSGAGTALLTGAGAMTAAAAVLAGAAVLGLTGTGDLTGPVASLSGAGTVDTGTVTGEGVLSPTGATLTGVGTVSLTGAGDLTAPPATLTVAGTLQLTGTGSITGPAATLSGADVAVVTGTGALSPAAPTLTGTSTATLTGAGDITGPSTTLDATGDTRIPATGALVGPAVTLDGAGSSTVTGTGELTSPVATLTADTTVTVSGEGTLTAPAPALSGEGTVVDTSLYRDIQLTGTLARAHAGTLVRERTGTLDATGVHAGTLTRTHSSSLTRRLTGTLEQT